MFESVEDLPYEDDERFEQTAVQYQEKYHKISSKYQKILMQESSVSNWTRVQPCFKEKQNDFFLKKCICSKNNIHVLR